MRLSRHPLVALFIPCLAASAAAAPSVTRSDLCSERRQIAWLHAGPCAAPISGWRASPLVPATDRADLPQGAQAHFDHYCVYDWVAQGSPSVAQVAALSAAVGGDIGPDCEVVSPQGSSVTDAVWPQLLDRFRHGTGWRSALPDTGGVATTVAVLDASPLEGTLRGRATPNEGRSGHGFAVGRVIRDLACPDLAAGGCFARVADRLALPLLPSGQRDTAGGGYFGAFSDVARAAMGSLALQARSAGGPLILNLSIGWAPDLLPATPALLGDVADPSAAAPGPRAVFDALQLAACQGHLVIAAAGNALPGPEAGTGPLLPGGWERAPLTAAACARFGLPRPPASTPYRPTLYAVGGIDADQQPLINARAGAEPRRVAFASHGLAPYADPADPALLAAGMPGPTEVYTGSSMAAAVTSGVAAAVWAYRPGLAAADVMAALWQSGAPVGRVADVCAAPGGGPCGLSPASPARAVRALSLQSALCGACATGAGLCPPVFALGCGGPPGPAPAAVAVPSALLSNVFGPFGVINDRSDPVVCLPDDVYDHPTAGGGAPCPDRQFSSPAAAPRVAPQPFDPLCPSCLMVDTGIAARVYTLKGEINSVYAGATFQDFTLKLDDGTVLSLDSYLKAQGLTSLTGGDTFSISGIDLGYSTTATQASLYATLVKGSTTYVIDSPILLY